MWEWIMLLMSRGHFTPMYAVGEWVNVNMCVVNYNINARMFLYPL